MKQGMTQTEIHKQIQDDDIVELYVLNKLPSDARRAFQEHYFSCDECFEKTQMHARFVAGVRHASNAGILTPSSSEILKPSGSSPWVSWLKPAFALTATASLALGITLGWLLFYQMPRLRQEIALERQAREQSERENQQNLDQARAEIENERRRLESERGGQAKQQSNVEEVA